ncbi:DUF1223 domain-containing protein [Sphingomonas japonica]|uniref:DUF1223 domain-containing protein n=1 Tax=Sphingomonas japonica TaxID=511662 RepID=A0ABX0TZ43_9SPHN|nr:DUF1223 domain-containing protein [Sphingomonas japonica]NIJ22761.1 hypothetical protein [Sphingomonas japonica]
MIRRPLVALILAGTAAAALHGIGSSQTPARPVAVELFTSQGCSSCPPADRIMAQLAADPGVVAITRPVTYWDRLGWKDTLASPRNTALQAAYSARGIPGAGNYTPQSVVQGRSGTVGGRGPAIRALIDQASRLPQPRVGIVRDSAGVTVAVSGTAPADARVSVVALRRSVDVAIGTGENGGRRLRYSNVFVDERPIGRWTGGAQRAAVPTDAIKVPGADRYAVLVRQGAAGPILAARYI